MFPRIRELRQTMRISQTEFAKLMGLSQSGYAKYETGNAIPVRRLIQLADIHNTSIEYLVGRTDKR